MSKQVPVLLTPPQARQLAQALAGLRGLIGVVAFVSPSVALRPWAGAAVAAHPGGRLVGRALGGRDLALSAGAFLAMRHDGRVRGWIEAGGLADTGDVLATLVAFRHLPKRTRWGVLALTLGAVAAAYVVAPSVDEQGWGTSLPPEASPSPAC
ncbi:MAG: hypothetical protein ACLQNG_08940 [Acidimicrobiales bacterium]|jgi:hypothetical protein